MVELLTVRIMAIWFVTESTLVWTFIVTGLEKGADDGIGAVLKSSARRATLSKNILLSTTKGFCEFSHKHQLEPVNSSNKQGPRICVFFLDN